jgi:hypothetical protein
VLPEPNRLFATSPAVPHAEQASKDANTMPARSRLPLPAMFLHTFVNCLLVREIRARERAINAFHRSSNR